jgi:SAM-dependent methyltransferase
MFRKRLGRRVDDHSSVDDNSSFQGFVDTLNGDLLAGWAWDSRRPGEPIDVDVYVDGKRVTSVRASHIGADLLAAGIGDGYHRWLIPLPQLVDDDRVHEIRVCYGGTSAQLTDSPKSYRRSMLDLVPQREPQAIAGAIYLRGNGVEIGALTRPTRVAAGAHTTFVDRMSTKDLRREYPELAEADLVDVGIVTDGETLAGVPDESQDYVIANNFLEHCQDPIATIKNFFRVLRPGGVAFLVVPNKRSNVDHMRPPTTVNHMIRDHEEGPQVSKHDHFIEWTREVLRVPEDEVESHAAQLIKDDYSIHLHVFTEFETIELFTLLKRRYDMPMLFEHIGNNRFHETVVVVRKEWGPVASPPGAEDLAVPNEGDGVAGAGPSRR